MNTATHQKLGGHTLPSGVGVLFFIQIFSTLSYAVLFSSLILYMTQTLHMSMLESTAITGTFIGFNYALHLVGGFFGGRFFQYRLLFVFGMLAQVAACILLSHAALWSFHWGLGTFLTGAGVNVTLINLMVTELFLASDPRRETAFLWNYSGMNIGFLIGFSIAGVAELAGEFHQLFLGMGVANAMTILLVLCNWHVLRDKHTALAHGSRQLLWSRGTVGMILFLLLLPALIWLMYHAELGNRLVLWGALAMGLFLCVSLSQEKTLANRQRLAAYLVLSVAGVLFWTLYMLAPMGMTLFAAHNVNRLIFDFEISPQWIQNINAFVIIVGGPMMSVFLARMRSLGFVFSVPRQFMLALFLIAAGFLLLPIGIDFAGQDGLVAFPWLFFYYVLQSIGELFLSPIGYAMIGQLAPERMQGILMGTWMMLSGVGGVLASYCSAWAIQDATSSAPLATNPGYHHVFWVLGISAVAAGLVLWKVTPLVNRWMSQGSVQSGAH